MNIYWKAAIAIVLVLSGFVSGCQHRASQAEKERLEAEAKYNAELAQKQAEIQASADAIQHKYEKEKRDAEKTISDLRASIQSGSMRLSVPVTRVSSDSRPASGEERAELDPATADRLVSIAADGDTAIRELNQCIDQYNAARK